MRRRPAFHLMEKIHSREDKYYLETAIHIGVGIKAILEEAKKYDALIIGDIPAKDRNALLKKCFEQDIRTYTVPKLSDILIRTSQELDIFDSPLLLSRMMEFPIFSDLSSGRWISFVPASNRGIIPILSSGGAVDLPDRPRSGLLQADPSHRGRKRISDLQFRTMIQNAEAKTGARLAAEHDDRILPVGHFLRRPAWTSCRSFSISGKVRCRS